MADRKYGRIASRPGYGLLYGTGYNELNRTSLLPMISAGVLGLEAWPRSRGQILPASVLALVSIIWPRPRVERGQGRGL